jgi:hypothetical protein
MSHIGATGRNSHRAWLQLYRFSYRAELTAGNKGKRECQRQGDTANRALKSFHSKHLFWLFCSAYPSTGRSAPAAKSCQLAIWQDKKQHLYFGESRFQVIGYSH